MDVAASPSLESILSLWPIASTLSQHLPVGDLISLARLSTTLRALLHGFDELEQTKVPLDLHLVRKELHIGNHGTPYWQRLKDLAPFECSSRTHTKGPDPKPCRYCSRPICDACIVRSSFARGHENTFQNRTRYLCRNCWDNGNSSRSQRYPLTPSKDSHRKRKWYDPDGSTRDYCTCTLKDDGWLCLSCKDLQNREAISSSEMYCHGQDCGAPLDADKDRRRICLWCNKALPRQVGGTTRYHWNQKMIEARARNAASRQADLEEYNRRRLKLMRMSRREMRGDEAVKDDPDADLPQFVRHLDTINYRRYMPDSAAPSANSVYDSKRGYWRYHMEFLLWIKKCCAHVPAPQQLSRYGKQSDHGALVFSRTNAEKMNDKYDLLTMMPSMEEDRTEEWCTLKAVILELLLVRKLDYETVAQTMHEEYDFSATIKEYRKMLHLWYSQDRIREHRRKSLDQEGDGDGDLGPSSNVEEVPRTESDTRDDHVIVIRNWRLHGGTVVMPDMSNKEERAENSETDSDVDDSDDSTRLPQTKPRPNSTQEPDLPSGTSSAPVSSAQHSADAETTSSTSEIPIPVRSTMENLVHTDEEPPPYTADGWTWQ
ncbi:uncharacterized protein Z518_05382 [Rhinocladiella mackenziei CBS 650.93]|uniref:Clr5 domain-containing protein n=1 Tax=Rhinocladiella mackenziei CBS 650.93 TaxID=1442369 RepID=A0A0D2FQT0_9EURO|nr:uncharacterized protein Z518_05382 [Rhinocladiella mackenziei CBS 650.93]KIX04512.1 hypothetical protein Z518_05382 [Rhinocladiella mackenziei CBS 650.93]